MSLWQTLGFTARILREFHISRAASELVAQRQDKRLRILLRGAVDKSPFYREKFRGIDVERCPLSELPTTTKAEMMDRFDELVTDPMVRRRDLELFVENPDNVGKLYLDRYPVCHTSGSLGQSLLVVQNLQTVELMFGFQVTRGYGGFKRGPWEALKRFFSPGRVAIIINRPGFFPSAWIFQQLPPALRPYVRFMYVAGSDPELQRKFREFRPTTLVGTPSALDVLALRAGDLEISHLQQITAMSETLTPAARSRIEKAFRVRIIDNYSSGECFFLSNGCHAGKGMHLNADWAILENVDDDNQAVPAGQLGAKALLTNLANDVQPFIRYEVADRIVMAESDCNCGNKLPRIERVEGRSADFFWVRSGEAYRPLLTFPFQHALEFVREIREWQAVQEERNRIVLRLEPMPETTVELAQVQARLFERLASVGLADVVEVEVQIVPRLEWDWRTGKFRRLVTKIGPPEDLAADLPRGAEVRAGRERDFDLSPSLVASESSGG